VIDLTVFDVGRGLSVLLDLPSRREGYASVGIIDCFAGSGRREPLLKEIDRKYGRKVQVEFLVLTHMHSDHFLGIGSLLERLGSRIGLIADSGIDLVHIVANEFPSNALYDSTARSDLMRLHEFKKKNRKKVRPLTSPGQILYRDSGNDVLVRTVAPPPAMLEDVNSHLQAVVRRLRGIRGNATPIAPPKFDLNRTSSAIEIIHQGCRIVIGGDVLQPAWNSVRGQVADLRSDIFVLSHHGASNGFPSRHWMKWISKSTHAIVSGEGYNQPSPGVVRSIKASGGRVYTTTRPGSTPRVASLADFALSFHHRWPTAGPQRGDVRCKIDKGVTVEGLRY
jgi:hypothetical protein